MAINSTAQHGNQVTHLVERHHRLPRERLGHQRLAGAGVALEQDALWRPRAQLGKGLGVLEKLDHLRGVSMVW